VKFGTDDDSLGTNEITHIYNIDKELLFIYNSFV